MTKPLDKILSHRFIVVMGKGGVGKSAVATSLAKHAADQGRRVCIFENSHTEALSPLFGKDPIGHEEVQVLDNLWICNLDPKKCFEKYVTRTIRSKTLFRLLFGNRLVELFVDALPGFDEILMFKEMFGAVEGRGQDPTYDLVIFDAPATGHGMNFLRTPSILMAMVGSGPVYNASKDVQDHLLNRDFTTLVPVTLGEEMPVTETQEMIEALNKNLSLEWSPIIVNMVHEASLSEAQLSELSAQAQSKAAKDLTEALSKNYEQAQLNARCVDKLRQSLDLQVLTLPRVPQLGVQDPQRILTGLEELACHLRNS